MLAIGHFVELCHTIDKVSNLFAELLCELFHGVFGVFDCVMQKPRCQDRTGRAHFSKNRGHGNGVGNIRIATFTFLTFMIFIRYFKGTLQNLNIFIGVIFPHGAYNRRQKR